MVYDPLNHKTECKQQLSNVSENDQISGLEASSNLPKQQVQTFTYFLFITLMLFPQSTHLASWGVPYDWNNQMSEFALNSTGLHLLSNVHSSFVTPLFIVKSVPVWRINYMTTLIN